MRKYLHLLSVTLLALVASTSCSTDKSSKLLDRVPKESEMVLVGNIKTIVESAGGSVDDGAITLPDFILDEFNGNGLAEVNSFLKSSGIDPDVCVWVQNFSSSQEGVLIFRLKDAGQFKDALKGKGYNEPSAENGLTVLSKNTKDEAYYCVIKDSYGYFAEGDRLTVNYIKEMIDEAKKASFSKNDYADYISSGNAFGVAMRIPEDESFNNKMPGLPTDLYEGIFCMKGSLTDDCISVDLKLYGDDGKPKDLSGFAKMMDYKAKINKKALSFLADNESLVFAQALKKVNWNEILDLFTSSLSRSERVMIPVIKNFLDKIDGTVAVGVGINGGLDACLNLNRDLMTNASLTVVIETKGGEAKNLIKDLKSLAETIGMPFEKTSKGFSITIPDENITVYAEAADGFLIFANHKISKGNDNYTVKSVDFNRYFGALAIAFENNSRLFRDLGIKYDLVFSAVANPENMESNMSLTIKGGSQKGVLAKAARILIDLKKNPDHSGHNYESASGTEDESEDFMSEDHSL